MLAVTLSRGPSVHPFIVLAKKKMVTSTWAKNLTFSLEPFLQM